MFHLFTTEGIRHDETLESLKKYYRQNPVHKNAKARLRPGERETDTYYSEKEQALQAYRERMSPGAGGSTMVHVYQVMSRPVITIPMDASLSSAMELMGEKEIQYLPVMDEAGKPVGIISERDLLHKTSVLFDDTEGEDSPVSSIMRSPMISTSSVTDIRRVVMAMFDHRAGCMPVLSESMELVGIVTRSDILHALVKSQRFSITA